MSPLFGLAHVAALALLVGGLWLFRQPGGNRTKALLMAIAAIVIEFNLFVASFPLPVAQ
jgi:hypothetical protein